MKVGMRHWLAVHRKTRLRIWREITRNLDRISRNQVSATILNFSHLDAGGAIEARVQDGEYEPPARAQQGCKRLHQGIDFSHVHQRHVAQGPVKSRGPESKQRGAIGRINNPVIDARPSTPLRKLDHRSGKIERCDVRARVFETPRRQSVSTGDIQQALAVFGPQQFLDSRPNQNPEEVVAFGHARVPEACVGIPGLLNLRILFTA